MRKLLLVIALVMAAPAGVLAEVETIRERAPVNGVVPPCDDAKVTNKPPCNIDSDSIKKPARMPNEKGEVIIPPEIPAEGLPNQDGEPLRDKTPIAPEKR